MIDNHLVSRVLERLIDIVQPTTRSDVNGHWLPPSAATGICRARIRMRPIMARHRCCPLPKSYRKDWKMTQRRASQGGNVPRNRFHEEAALCQ